MKGEYAARTLVACCIAMQLSGVGCGGNRSRETKVAAIVASDDITLERVAGVLRESPHEYLAAIQEVVDDSKCYGPADGSSCPLTVRVVEFIAGEPGRSDDRKVGWTYSTMEMRMEEPRENRRIGRQRLVVAFPTAEQGLYGNRLLLLDPTPADVAKLRSIFQALSTSDGGRLSNHRQKLTGRPVTTVANNATAAPARPAV